MEGGRRNSRDRRIEERREEGSRKGGRERERKGRRD